MALWLPWNIVEFSFICIYSGYDVYSAYQAHKLHS